MRQVVATRRTSSNALNHPLVAMYTTNIKYRFPLLLFCFLSSLYSQNIVYKYPDIWVCPYEQYGCDDIELEEECVDSAWMTEGGVPDAVFYPREKLNHTHQVATAQLHIEAVPVNTEDVSCSQLRLNIYFVYVEERLLHLVLPNRVFVTRSLFAAFEIPHDPSSSCVLFSKRRIVRNVLLRNFEGQTTPIRSDTCTLRNVVCMYSQ